MNILFFDQPELFYTINVIPGILYKNISVSLFLGGLLLFFAFIVFFLRKRVGLIKNNFNKLIIFIFVLFWLPLYANFFYNNFYDTHENLPVLKYNNDKKSIVRLCNLDNGGGAVCKMFSYVKYSKNMLPEKSSVKIISDNPLLATYLNYYFFPYFKAQKDLNNAEYVLYYFSNNYRFENDTLYEMKNIGGKIVKFEIGKYSLMGGMGANRLILKKLN